MVKSTRKMLFTSTIITVIVFFIGIFFGISLDNYKENQVLTELKFSDLDTQSYFLEGSLLKESSNSICEILQSRVKTLRFRLNKIGKELISSEEGTFSKSKDLDYLKRKYTLSEVQFLVLLNDLKENCGDTYNPILFFYTKDDSVSRDQGYVLTWANEKYSDSIVVLSFDKDYGDEPLIKTLKLQYDIKSKSAVVIDGKTYSQFIGKAKLDEILKNKIS